MELPFFAIIIVLVLLILVFSSQFIFLLKSTKAAIVSMLSGDTKDLSCKKIVDDDDMSKTEHLEDQLSDAQKAALINDPKAGSNGNTQPNQSDALNALGYGASGVSWDEAIKTSELDPSVAVNHSQFVADVRRFSSTSGFTSVADDNTSPTFSNFRGLMRPSAPLNMLGSDARQVFSEDETVLSRTKPFRWNSTS